MHRRIKTIRKTLGLSQTDFARQIGLGQTSLSMIESGKNTFIDKNVKLICAIFNVNEHWLRTGDGEMFRASPYEKEFTEILACLMPEVQQYLLLMAQELLHTQQKLLGAEATRAPGALAPDKEEPPE
jgi:transcriptional regulator with XRE-family HTH domain